MSLQRPLALLNGYLLMSLSRPKTGVIIRSFRLTDFLARVILNYAHVDRIIVANFPFANFSKEEDNTSQVVGSLNLRNIKLITGGVKSQAEVFSLAQDELLDMDVIFISDADEFLLRTDQDRIVDDLMRGRHNKAEVMVIDYKTPDAIEAYAQRTHMPIVAFKPKVEFSQSRVCSGEAKKYNDIYLHHFGYCVKELEWKKINLWYPRHSFDQIVCTQIRRLPIPGELAYAIATP